jgi:hypothetical protein
MEFLASLLVEGVLTLLAEVFNLGLRKSLRTADATQPLGDALVGLALGFILGLASVYFFPVLAIKVVLWQWINAFASPLLAGGLIVMWRRRRSPGAAQGAPPSWRVLLFQAFVVGLAFNLARLLFGH